MVISKRAFWTLFIVTLAIAIKNIYVPLHPDEAYYWEWSRHLALSYFDGPPLMAYIIHFFTKIFGNTVTGVKLSGVFCTSTGVFFVYRLARELFDKETAYVALILLLLSPIAQIFYIFTTLDPALFCFWSMTLYCFYMAIKNNSNKYRYLALISLSLTCLAKYTGILLGVELILYLLLSSTYRKEFKNIHWYLGAVIAVFVFSPVFIWNWQHDFIAFAYQYNHGVAQEKVFRLRPILSFIVVQMGVVNPLFFIGTFFFVGRYWKKIIYNEKLLYLTVPFLGTFFFFLYEGIFKRSHLNWPLCAYISASILLAYYIVHYRHKILYRCLNITNIGAIMVVHVLVITGLLAVHRDAWDSTFISQLNAVYNVGDVVISDRYETASQSAFHLKNQPQAFILDDVDPHEYQFWRKLLLKNIQNGSVKSALYIGSSDNIARITPFFHHSKLIKQINYSPQMGLSTYTMSLYRVWGTTEKKATQ